MHILALYWLAKTVLLARRMEGGWEEEVERKWKKARRRVTFWSADQFVTLHEMFRSIGIDDLRCLYAQPLIGLPVVAFAVHGSLNHGAGVRGRQCEEG